MIRNEWNEWRSASVCPTIATSIVHNERSITEDKSKKRPLSLPKSGVVSRSTDAMGIRKMSSASATAALPVAFTNGK